MPESQPNLQSAEQLLRRPKAQVMVALSSTPRCSSRRRTRATAGSCVTEALRIACRTMCAANFTSRQLRSAASTSTDDQSPTGSKRCARYNPSSASPLHSTVRLSWRQRRRSCALIWLGPGNLPRVCLAHRQACCTVEWEPLGDKQVSSRLRPLTCVPLHARERHVAPLPRQLSLEIRRVCAPQDPQRR